MKKLWIIMLLSIVAFEAEAQKVVYYSLKDLLKASGDTIELPRVLTVEKRSKNQILLSGGADYKIDANRKLVRHNLKSRYHAVQIDTCLYINCRKYRFNKFRFGGYYASAMLIKDKVYFRAVPVGMAAISISDDRNIGLGAIGEAISSSTMGSKRVYYEIDIATGKVDFVSKEKMLSLLEGYPWLKDLYLKEDSEEAHVTGKYLIRIKKLGL